MHLDFYFDYISPYAYLAWHELGPLADEFELSVRPIPTLLAGLLNHHGSVGPAEIEAKRRYVFIDCTRHARVRGLDFAPPPTHPFNPLLALRASGLEMSDDVRRDFVSALFKATWATRRGIEQADTVDAIAAECGLEDVVARANQPEAKSRLREATEEAIQKQVFGVPSMVVQGQLFWGLDSFSHLRAFLAGADGVSDEEISQFKDLKASAKRS